MYRCTDEVHLQFIRSDGTASAKPYYEGTAETANLSAMMRNNLLIVEVAPVSYGAFPVEAPDSPKTQDK